MSNYASVLACNFKSFKAQNQSLKSSLANLVCNAIAYLSDENGMVVTTRAVLAQTIGITCKELDAGLSRLKSTDWISTCIEQFRGKNRLKIRLKNKNAFNSVANISRMQVLIKHCGGILQAIFVSFILYCLNNKNRRYLIDIDGVDYTKIKIDYVADLLGKSTRTVFRLIADLKRRGVVAVHKQMEYVKRRGELVRGGYRSYYTIPILILSEIKNEIEAKEYAKSGFVSTPTDIIGISSFYIDNTTKGISTDNNTASSIERSTVQNNAINFLLLTNLQEKYLQAAFNRTLDRKGTVTENISMLYSQAKFAVTRALQKRTFKYAVNLVMQLIRDNAFLTPFGYDKYDPEGVAAKDYTDNYHENFKQLYGPSGEAGTAALLQSAEAEQGANFALQLQQLLSSKNSNTLVTQKAEEAGSSRENLGRLLNRVWD